MNSGLSTKGSLGRLAAIFAAILLVSSGLCGVNTVLMFWFVPMLGPAQPTHAQNTLGSLLMVTGFIELGGIAFGFVCLIAVALVGIFTYFFGKRQSNEDES
jgi:hypothetical protein